MSNTLKYKEEGTPLLERPSGQVGRVLSSGATEMPPLQLLLQLQRDKGGQKPCNRQQMTVMTAITLPYLVTALQFPKQALAFVRGLPAPYDVLFIL